MASRTGYAKENLRRVFYKRTFIITVLGSLFAVWALGALVIFALERRTNPELKTYGDALWMLIITMATVGYGDKVPVTTAGRIADVISLVMGFALITTAITAHAATRIAKAKGRRRGLSKKNSLRNHFLVCGWNNRGEYTLARLVDAARESRTPIIILCEQEDSPYEDDLVFFVSGSPISEKDLRTANAGQAKSVVLLADESTGGNPGDIDARTVLAALSIKKLNQDARITAEALVPENTAHLHLAGVTEILDYSVIAGNLLAQSAMRYGLIELITSMSSRVSDSRMKMMPVTPDMLEKPYQEVCEEIESAGNCSVIGVKTKDGLQYVIERGARLTPDDKVLVVTRDSGIDVADLPSDAVGAPD